MTDKADILAEHAARRRAFLLRSAVTAPAVALLLEQGMKPAQAQTYGGPVTTTPTL